MKKDLFSPLSVLFVILSILSVCIPTIDLFSGKVYAQEEEISVDAYLQDMTVVVGSGISGAILGLSTLPFEEQPSDHLRHILVGGAVGIIVGVAFVAWSQASRSKENYQEETWFQYNPPSSPAYLEKMRPELNERVVASSKDLGLFAPYFVLTFKL